MGVNRSYKFKQKTMSIALYIIFQYIILGMPFYILRKIKEYTINEIIKEIKKNEKN